MSPIKRCCRKDLQPLSPLARSRFHTRAVPHPYQVTPMGFLPAHGGDALTMEQVQLDGAVLHIKTFRQHKLAQEIGKKPQQPTLHLSWELKSGNTLLTQPSYHHSALNGDFALSLNLSTSTLSSSGSMSFPAARELSQARAGQ